MSEIKASRPFPWKCGNCREKAVDRAIIPYPTEYDYDGKSYALNIVNFEVPRCGRCGEIVFDNHANRQITDALRREVGLLFPEQIRQNRESLGLRQRDLASHLGVAESTLSRWETGAQIQQRSLDRLMRLYFASVKIRQALGDTENLKQFGEHVSDTIVEATAGSLPAEEASNRGVEELLPALRAWVARAEPLTPLKWRALLETRLQSYGQHSSQRSFSSRWFVAPLFGSDEEDTERANRISMLASELDEIPESKRQEALDQVHRFFTLLIQ